MILEAIEINMHVCGTEELEKAMEFIKKKNREGVYAKYHIEVEPENKKMASIGRKDLEKLENGEATVNEIRAKYGLPIIADGEILLVKSDKIAGNRGSDGSGIS